MGDGADAARSRVDHLEVTGGAIGITLDHGGRPRSNDRVRVDHCFIHDLGFTTRENGHEALRCFPGLESDPVETGILFEWILMERVDWEGEGEAPSIKRPGVTMRYCSLVDSPISAITMRRTWGTVIEHCYVKDSREIRVHGDGNTVRGCVLDGPRVLLRVASGDGYLEDPAPTGIHAAARDTTVSDNDFRGGAGFSIGTGYTDDTLPCLRTRGARNSLAPTLGPYERETTVGAGVPRLDPATRLLTVDDLRSHFIGPLARL